MVDAAAAADDDDDEPARPARRARPPLTTIGATGATLEARDPQPATRDARHLSAL